MSENNGRIERIERALERTAENQLKQAEWLDKLTGVEVKHSEWLDKLTGVQVKQAEWLDKFTGVQVKHSEWLVNLDNRMAKLAESLQHAVELHRKLELAQLETTEKLDALIKIADEWIRRKPPSDAN